MVSLSSAQSIRMKVISQWPTSVVGADGVVVTLSGGTYTITLDATAIPDGSITLNQMADIPTDSLIGRDTAGSGVPENITLDTTLEFSGAGVLGRAALTGDVTTSANVATIAADAVTTTKINDSAVTTAKINDTAVTTAKITDLNITTAKLAANVVTTAKINDGAVTLAKQADVATARIMGRVTASTGVQEALTGTQATTLLDAVVGDSGSGGTKGLVPAPGAGDAAAGKFLKADGTFATPASGSSPSYVKLSETQTSGTASGGFTSGAWQTRTLNTEDSDADGVCSLSSNQFTLDAGTYEIIAYAPAFRVDAHQAKLRNITDSTDELIGQGASAGSSDVVANFSIVTGRFTIASSKAFEIQHRCSTTKTSNGFGQAMSFSVSEIYTVVILHKVA